MIVFLALGLANSKSTKSFIYYFIICSRDETEWQRWSKVQRKKSSIYWFILQMARAEARTQKLHSVFLLGWQGSRHSGHPPVFPGMSVGTWIRSRAARIGIDVLICYTCIIGRGLNPICNNMVPATVSTPYVLFPLLGMTSILLSPRTQFPSLFSFSEHLPTTSVDKFRTSILPDTTDQTKCFLLLSFPFPSIQFCDQISTWLRFCILQQVLNTSSPSWYLGKQIWQYILRWPRGSLCKAEKKHMLWHWASHHPQVKSFDKYSKDSGCCNFNHAIFKMLARKWQVKSTFTCIALDKLS